MLPRTIRARLVLLVAFTALPLVGVTSLMMSRAVASNRAAITRGLESDTATAAGSIDTLLLTIEARLRDLAATPEVQAQDIPATDALLDRLSVADPTLANILVLDGRGSNVGSPRADIRAARPTRLNLSVLQAVLASGRAAVSGALMSPVMREQTLVIAVPRREGEPGSGVVAAAITLSDFAALIAPRSLADRGTFTVFDAGGVVLARTPDEAMWLGRNVADADLASRTAASPSGTGSLRELGQDDRLGAWMALRRAPWRVVMTQPSSNATEILRPHLVQGLSLTAALVVVAVVGAIVVAGRTVGPLRRLAAVARAISGGDLHVRSSLDGVDEVRDLAVAFNRLADATEARLNEARVLGEFLAVINRGATLDEVARSSVDTLIDTLGCGGAALALVDADGTLHFRSVRGLPVAALKTPSGDERAPALDAVLGHPEAIAALYHVGLTAAVTILCRAESRVVALLIAAAWAGDTLDAIGPRLLGALADGIGVAVARAELVERERERARRLRAVDTLTDTALSRLALDDLLAELLGRIREAVAADVIALLHSPDEGRHFIVGDTLGMGEVLPAGTRYPVTSGIARRVVTGRQPLLVTGTDELSSLGPVMRTLGLAELAALPLLVEGRLTGLLYIGTRQPGRFARGDVRIMQLVADRIALAIDRARLYQEARNTANRERAHAAQLRMLADASVAMSATRTVEDALQVAVGQARTIVGVHYALATLIAAHSPAPVPRAISLSDELRGQPARQARIECIDVATLASGAQLSVRLTRTELEARADMVPPVNGLLAASLLGADGRRLGAIQLADKIAGQFTNEDEAILVQLAQMTAAAIDNVRLQKEAAAAAAAVEADRLKDELLSTVSHELRTPLAAIKGFASTMLMYNAKLDHAEQISFLQEIDGAADRLIELVDNLLHLSRLESGALQMVPAPIAFAGMVQAAVEDARRRYPDREITFDCPDELPLVFADARRMRQVAANLIDNAVKFAPDGGPVEVRAGRIADDGVSFSVTDHGIGIPPEHQARVFERFYRVPGGRTVEIGGTGLGLAICRRIVEEHGGKISVVSAEGKGTTFTVILPTLAAEEPGTDARSGPAQEAREGAPAQPEAR